MLGEMKLHAGDFGEGTAHYFDSLRSFSMPKGGFFKTDSISATEIKTVEKASEESVKRLGGTIGWGVAGGLVLGPVGILAGLLLGGKSNETTFVVKFKDGRKFLATTDSDTYKKILAATF